MRAQSTRVAPSFWSRDFSSPTRLESVEDSLSTSPRSRSSNGPLDQATSRNTRLSMLGSAGSWGSTSFASESLTRVREPAQAMICIRDVRTQVGEPTPRGPGERREQVLAEQLLLLEQGHRAQLPHREQHGREGLLHGDAEGNGFAAVVP